MSVLTAMFLWTFLAIYSVIYPIFKRPIFATYVMILALIAFGTYRMYGVARGSSLAVKGVKAKLNGGYLGYFCVFTIDDGLVRVCAF